MPTDRPIEQFELNDFFIGVLKSISKREPTDVVTPRNPLFKALEKSGSIETRPPSHTYTEDLLTELPDKSITISRDSDMKERDFTPQSVSTQAQYDTIQRIDTLTIEKYKYDNNKMASALTDIVVRRKKQTDKARRNALAGYLWYGLTEGSSHVFGLTEAVQFDPSAPPAAGNVGRVAQTGNNTWWQNVAHNFDAPFATVTSGFWDATAFLESDDHSLLQCWIDCTEMEGGDTEAGSPDIMPCNQQFFKRFAALVDQKLVFNDTMNKRDLGIDSFYYRGMDVFWDRNCPDDPNNSDYGVAYMLNTNSFAWTWSEGLVASWSDMWKLTKTGFAWDCSTQFSIVWRNRRQNGVVFGVKDKTIS